MHEGSELKLESAHGVQLLRREVRTWNGVIVSVKDMSCSPGRAWHDVSPRQNTMAIVLEQIGGRVEHGRRLISHLSPTGRARNTSITPQRVCRFGDIRTMFAVFEGRILSLIFPLWNQYWVKASTSSKLRRHVFSSSMSAYFELVRCSPLNAHSQATIPIYTETAWSRP
jgi:hypothetical protein